MNELRGALCAGHNPETWFPLDEDGPGSTPAREVCANCPVREACLQAALTAGADVGIWGGLSGQERRNLRLNPFQVAA